MGYRNWVSMHWSLKNAITKSRWLRRWMIAFCLVTAVLSASSAVFGAELIFPSGTDTRFPEAETAVAINLIQVESGFSAPVQVTHAGDASDRLFVVEQPGRIRVIQNGGVLPQPYLDISALVGYGGEKGLLGLAFHPQFATNGYFYVNYTRQGDGATVIARYQAVPPSSNSVDPASGTILLVVLQPYANHNGGQLLFSPVDGYLYIGMGDGGSGGDPQNNAQNINNLLGAMLRIDVDKGLPYGVPVDNPYVGKAGLDELWAIGLRNPWRFSFDRLTGDLYIADVGQNLWEEVDYQAGGTPGGLNFGWRCMEGTHPYDFSGACPTAGLTGPIAEYSHAEGRSISGGFVYRGVNYPALYGTYFYADYVTGKVWALKKLTANPVTWSTPVVMLETGMNISAFGEDESGELYVVSMSQGAIFQLADANGPVPNLVTSRKAPSSLSADPGALITYTITLNNIGGTPTVPLFMTDTIPGGLTYVPGSLQATSGTIDASSAPSLLWYGLFSDAPVVTLRYQVRVTGEITGSIVNAAYVTSPAMQPLILTASLSVPRSLLVTTAKDFVMPGTQPGTLHIDLQPSVDCDSCHSAPIYDRWRGSMMSQAGRDPVFWSALAVANVDAPEAGELCLRCHMPTGWYAGRSHPSDGSALNQNDIANGVPCNLCHRMVDNIPSTTDETSTIDLAIRSALTLTFPLDYTGGAAIILDPDDNRRGPFSFNPDLPYHTAYQSDFLNQDSDAVNRARLCGSCHNVDNPVLQWDAVRGQYWPNTADTPAQTFDGTALFPVERTYDEWLYSQYAREGVLAPQFAGAKSDGIVSACQDCHLPRQAGYATDAAFNPVWRDCGANGCLPEHGMAGGNTWVPQLLQSSSWRLDAVPDSSYLDETTQRAHDMLRKAATMTVTLTPSGTGKIAAVRVTNQSGHKLPTGYPEGRQMWLRLQAFNSTNQLVYESGAYDVNTGSLLRDSDIKVYEVQQGMTPQLAAFLGQPAGKSFHFVLNNTVVKDNRIPPRGVQQLDYDRPGLRPVGAVYADGQHWDETLFTVPASTERVLVTLYYQTASKEYIDFLRGLGGVDGLALGALWDGSKSPPVIMAQAWTPDYVFYMPVCMRNK